MNVSERFNAAACLDHIEQLCAAVDETLALLSACTDHAQREQLLGGLASTLQQRGTVLDALIAWCSSSDGKRTINAERQHWHDAFERLHSGDLQRAHLLGKIVENAAQQLRTRVVQQAVFIYHQGSQ